MKSPWSSLTISPCHKIAQTSKYTVLFQNTMTAFIICFIWNPFLYFRFGSPCYLIIAPKCAIQTGDRTRVFTHLNINVIGNTLTVIVGCNQWFYMVYYPQWKRGLFMIKILYKHSRWPSGRRLFSSIRQIGIYFFNTFLHQVRLLHLGHIK